MKTSCKQHVDGARRGGGRRHLLALGALASLGLGLTFGAPAMAAGEKDDPLLGWIKTCAGKNNDFCVTRREVFDPAEKALFSPLAITELKSKKKTRLRVTMPYYMTVQVPKDPKAKPKKGKKMEMAIRSGFVQWNVGSGIKMGIDGEKPMNLKMTVCHRIGCAAVIDVTPELMGKLKKAKRVLIAGDSGGRGLFLAVSMEGFAKTLEGKPMAQKDYEAAWGRWIQKERARIAELIKKDKAAREKAAKEKKK